MIFLRFQSVRVEVLLFLGLLMSVVVVEAQPPYDDCSLEDFYSSLPADPTTWKIQQVAELLASKHRNQVVFSNTDNPGVGDSFAALKDLDAGATIGTSQTVRLLYQQADTPANLIGPAGWVQEHIWPQERGLIEGTMAYLDLHNMRPAGFRSSSSRGSRYFGECYVLEKDGACEIEPNGMEDTCVCSRVFDPNSTAKGVIARALMYMHVRYYNDLVLTDCPFDRKTMAYLSQMLQWNREYDSTIAEKDRNDKVCRDYQGVRNPFVDFPFLAKQFFEPPRALPEPGREIYLHCEQIPTSAPTFESGDCESVNPGDLYIFMLNSDDPDQVAIFLMTELQAGFEIYMTDNPWNGSGFEDTEGTVMLKLPTKLGESQFFGYGQDLPFGSDWTAQEGTFSLSTAGEQIFLYCLKGDGSPRALHAFSYNGAFQASNLSEYKSDESALPDSLREEGSVVLPHSKNLLYAGPTGELTQEELARALEDPSNWKGSNDARYALNVGSGGSKGPSCRSTIHLTATLVVIGVTSFLIRN